MRRLDLSLENRMLKALGGRPDKTRPVESWLVAVSGGLDSMVLAEMLLRWRRYLKVRLIVAHIHHGTQENAAYRQQAQELVRAWAKRHKLKFVSNRTRHMAFTSEADLRDFRWRALRRWALELNCTCIAVAHHRDDLLETRLLRLLRGVAGPGLESMCVRRGRILRPLLDLSRVELEGYAKNRAVRFLHDPSNTETDKLRNWLRQEWLAQLEEHQKGARQALARSLALLAEGHEQTFITAEIAPYVGLRRETLRETPMPLCKKVLAEYFRALGVRGYGRTHVEELAKRLMSPRREFQFEMLGQRFFVTPDLVWASRV